MNQNNLGSVDWDTLPIPQDDGAASHLVGMSMPDIELISTDGGRVNLSCLSGKVVIFAYPMMGRPGVALPDGWDMIPGARGCTPQSCAFRDLHSEIRSLGVESLFGLSTQDSQYQREAVDRLHLSFPMLSDEEFEFSSALRLPTMSVDGKTLLKRLTLILENSIVEYIFYPVFPPDKNADDVIDYLRC